MGVCLKQRVTVAVCGVQRGAGVTNFCISLLRYIRVSLNKRALIIDCSETKELFRARKDNMGIYLQAGIEVLNCSDPDAYSQAADGYDFLILDLGADYKGHEREFYCSDKRYILGNVGICKRDAFHRFLSSNIPLNMRDEKICFLTAAGQKAQAREFEKNEKIRVWVMPFIDNPLKVDKCSYGFFQEVFNN